MDILQWMLIVCAALALLTLLSSFVKPRQTAEGTPKRKPLTTILALLTLLAIIGTFGYSFVSDLSVSITRNPTGGSFTVSPSP